MYLANRDRVRIRAALVITFLALVVWAGSAGYLRDIAPDYCPPDAADYRPGLLPPGCGP